MESKVNPSLAELYDLEYIVVNENTLAYRYEKYPKKIFVLRASLVTNPQSRFNECVGAQYLDDDDVVEIANEKDFERFNVIPTSSKYSLDGDYQ